jgi:dodecin
MNEHIYKQIELTGSSKTSIEDAVQNAISKASKTLHNLHWFQVVESRGYIENNKIDYWQVTIKGRVPPLWALRETLRLPAGVFGPVDRSHGFQR